MSAARSWQWALAIASMVPACTYVVAPLDDVRVFVPEADAGGDTAAISDTPQDAPDTTVTDTLPVPDTAPDTLVDTADVSDAGPCTTLLAALPARATLRPDSPMLVLRDLNGDGKLDMIAPSRPRNAVQVLLGNGDGSFGPYTEVPVSVNPIAVAVGDLDGDGKLDLVATSSPGGAGAVSVRLGNGDGTFAAKTDFVTGAGTVSVALADVNGDAKLDVVAANFADSSVSVLLGKGDGTFEAKVDYTVDGGGKVVVVDTNGDAKLDIVVANGSTDSVSVLRGNGDGTFLAKVDYPTDKTPTDLAVGDVNGDGRPDLVVSNASVVVPSVLSVLLGKADGTFAPKVSVVTGMNPYGVALVDLDGDGKLDIAAACVGDATVTVHRGVGDGTFEAPEPYATFASAAPIALAAGDVDKDGRVDVVAIDDFGMKTITLRNACK